MADWEASQPAFSVPGEHSLGGAGWQGLGHPSTAAAQAMGWAQQPGGLFLRIRTP